MTSCGATIRERRLAMGLTQDQLADQSGVSRRTIQRAELGTHRSSPLALRALTDFLGIHPMDGEAERTIVHPPNGGEAPAPEVES